MDDNEIKRRLAGRATEYMMFKDEEDTKVPVEISSSDRVIDFLDLEESKNKIQSDIQSDQLDVTLGAEIKMLLGLFLIHLTSKASAYTNR